jgi:uncharacterized membrane protein
MIGVIKNSISAAILTGLLAALVFRCSSNERKKVFLICVAAATVAAVGFTILRWTTAINRGMVNTWVLSLSFIASLLLLVFLWLIVKSFTIEKVLVFSASVLTGTLLFYALPPLFLMPWDFVLPGQSMFSTDFLFPLAGALAGLLLVILTGLGVFHGAKKSRDRFLRVIVSAALVINMMNQAANIIQFLMARRIILPRRNLFRVIMAAVNHSDYFMFALIAVAVLLALAGWIFINKGRIAENFKNPAERRKFRAGQRRNLRWSVFTVLCLVFSVVALTGLKAWDEKAVVLSPAEPMTIQGTEILIPVTQIEDGKLHRFAWTASDGTEVRFIVIKKSPSAYGVGFDACDICGNTGYYERRDGVVCRLCDVVMNKSTIGFKGGCNPVPLAYTIREGNMVVADEDLENEKTRFKL